MSWFLVLKNQELVNTTLGATMDWENEVVQDEKKDCKKKLLELLKYLSTVEIPFENHPESRWSLNIVEDKYVARKRGKSYISHSREEKFGHIVLELYLDDIEYFDEETICLYNEKIVEVVKAAMAKSTIKNKLDLGEDELNYSSRTSSIDRGSISGFRYRTNVSLERKDSNNLDYMLFRLRYTPDENVSEENEDKIARILPRIVQILT